MTTLRLFLLSWFKNRRATIKVSTMVNMNKENTSFGRRLLIYWVFGNCATVVYIQLSEIKLWTNVSWTKKSSITSAISFSRIRRFSSELLQDIVKNKGFTCNFELLEPAHSQKPVSKYLVLPIKWCKRSSYVKENWTFTSSVSVAAYKGNDIKYWKLQSTSELFHLALFIIDNNEVIRSGWIHIAKMVWMDR